MIEEFVSNGKLVVTSDRWHVIHAEWSPGSASPAFTRSIVSEHLNSSSALEAGRALKSQLVSRMKARAKAAWDQVMVRRPSAETDKVAGRLGKGHRRRGDRDS